MNENATRPIQLPTVDLNGLCERQLLRAELSSSNSQLRNFAPIRDRLAAAGGNVNETYRKILSRRDEIEAELQRLRPQPLAGRGTRSVPPRLDRSLLDLPLAPAQSLPIGGFGLGFSGYVPIGFATDGIAVTPAHTPGGAVTTGSIKTDWLGDRGWVQFSGVLKAGPAPGPYDPSIKYFWQRNWLFVVPLPVPSWQSLLTYRFNYQVAFSPTVSGDSAFGLGTVSVGEVVDLLPGANVIPITEVAWPVDADLDLPTSRYNGRNGTIFADGIVQRSFHVEAGRTPAVAVVVGATIGTSSTTEVIIDDGPELGESFFNLVGPDSLLNPFEFPRMAFHYEPEFVVAG
jgi:hypothetical protein